MSAIVQKHLMEGEFSDCDLTLEELHDIEASLIKSLAVVYDGRVK